MTPSEGCFSSFVAESKLCLPSMNYSLGKLKVNQIVAQLAVKTFFKCCALKIPDLLDLAGKSQ